MAVSPRQPGEGQLAFDSTFFPEFINLDEPLDTREKLTILLDAKVAGFLPGTNREKNDAVCLLDYIGNPTYPGGVHDHLAEIYQKQIKEAMKAGMSRSFGAIQGGIAVQSKIYEYGDYCFNALYERNKLGRLRTYIDDCPNPNVSLAELSEEIDTALTDARSLIRYMDVRALARGQKVGIKDPLLTHERRIEPRDGKNKIVEDLYTGKHRDEVMEDYIAGRLQELTVGQSRQVVTEAIVSEEKRRAYWAMVLEQRYYEYQRYADKAAVLAFE